MKLTGKREMLGSIEIVAVCSASPEEAVIDNANTKSTEIANKFCQPNLFILYLPPI